MTSADNKPPRTSAKLNWAPWEDDRLKQLVAEYGCKRWGEVAEHFTSPQRTRTQLQHRWEKVLRAGIKRGAWTPEEDAILTAAVEELGTRNWTAVALRLPERLGKQARERWCNHLQPGVDKTSVWSEDEDRIILKARLQGDLGWAALSYVLPGRAENSIKNHYNSALKHWLEAALDEMAATKDLKFYDEMVETVLAMRRAGKAVATQKPPSQQRQRQRRERERERRPRDRKRKSSARDRARRPEPTRSRSRAKRARPAPESESVSEDDDDDDEPPRQPRPKRAVRTVRTVRAVPIPDAIVMEPAPQFHSRLAGMARRFVEMGAGRFQLMFH